MGNERANFFQLTHTCTRKEKKERNQNKELVQWMRLPIVLGKNR